MSTSEETHWGADPGHGGLTQHRGRSEDCSAPDCADLNWPPRDERGRFLPYVTARAGTLTVEPRDDGP